MKKTQKILDILKYIEALNLTCDELDRLTSEVEDLKGSDYEDELEDIGDDSDVNALKSFGTIKDIAICTKHVTFKSLPTPFSL